MYALIFFMIGVILSAGLIVSAIRSAWKAAGVLFSLLFVMVVISAIILGGLFVIAFPILIFIGVIGLMETIRPKNL